MKSNLYTGTGDSGMTSLVGGQRISKFCVRLEAYGTVDEFSSFLGVVCSSPDCPQELREQMLEIQNRLFDAGCYLATAAEGDDRPDCNGIDDRQITQLEGWIDAFDEQTPKIRAFILPSGSQLAAHCHVARSVCRRAERRILELSADTYIDPKLLCWFNRLSDYLFIAARFLNHCACVPEITWKQASKP